MSKRTKVYSAAYAYFDGKQVRVAWPDEFPAWYVHRPSGGLQSFRTHAEAIAYADRIARGGK